MLPGIDNPVFLSHKQISAWIVEMMLWSGHLGKRHFFWRPQKCGPMSVDLSRIISIYVMWDTQQGGPVFCPWISVASATSQHCTLQGHSLEDGSVSAVRLRGVLRTPSLPQTDHTAPGSHFSGLSALYANSSFAFLLTQFVNLLILRPKHSPWTKAPVRLRWPISGLCRRAWRTAAIGLCSGASIPG